MSELPLDAPKIESDLYTTTQAVNSSSLFPGLVEGAALRAKVAYSRDLLVYVASQDDVTRMFYIPVNSTIDEVIRNVLIASPKVVDEVIKSAVARYVPVPGGTP